MKNFVVLIALLLSTSAFSQVSTDLKKASVCVVLSPNPSMGHLHVNAPKGSTCQLISQKGTYIGTWDVKEEGFDLDGLPSGSYIVVVQDENELATRRFTVL